MTGRRRHWISYLTLILVIVGAAAHGFLSQAAERMQAAGVAFAEGTTLTDRGTLPTVRGARQLTDARKSRTAPTGKADDSDTLPTIRAAKLQAPPPSTELQADLGRRVPTVFRTAHRPRDPPVSA